MNKYDENMMSDIENQTYDELGGKCTKTDTGFFISIAILLMGVYSVIIFYR